MHHSDNAFTTWSVAKPSKLKNIQTKVFQGKQPHPHQAVLDPTGKYLLVPDLGLDQIHVYTFDSNTLKFTPKSTVTVPSGYGPRHLTFATRGKKTFAYLMTEFAITIIGYEVSYNNGIQLKKLFENPLYGGKHHKDDASGSEITTSVSIRQGVFVSAANAT